MYKTKLDLAENRFVYSLLRRLGVGMTVLDVGCGTGFGEDIAREASGFLKLNYRGVDPSQNMLDKAASRKEDPWPLGVRTTRELYCGQVEDSGFPCWWEAQEKRRPSSSFGVTILSLWSACYIEDLRKHFEILQSLKIQNANFLLVTLTPTRLVSGRYCKGYSHKTHDLHLRTKGALLKEIQQADVCVSQSGSFSGNFARLFPSLLAIESKWFPSGCDFCYAMGTL